MVSEPLFEYAGMHLTGYTVRNTPDDEDEDAPEEVQNEPEILYT